jgi:tripartite-type tricarboxylate transporter receptor subunit TctC
VLEHKPGASAVVGSEVLAKSPADGYTLMMGYTAHSTNMLFNPTLPYDTVRDFTPVVYVCNIPTLLVVHPSNPANTVQELVATMKKGGQYSFASGGVGATAHLYGELLKQVAHVDLLHVPYKGNAPALNDLLGGHVTLMFDITSTALPQVKAGQLKALATTAGKRLAAAPQIPTMVESGFPGFNAVAWYMLLAPGNLPPDILSRLNAEANHALRDERVRGALTAQGFEVVGGTPQEADEFLRSEMQRWAAVVAASGLKSN